MKKSMGRNRKHHSAINVMVAVFWIAVAHIGLAQAAATVDKENCLMCHKYAYMGRIDENGQRHNYHVDQTMYAHSVHRNVSCRECHTSIRKIPHDPVTENVNCATVCHVKPPFSDEKFSHANIVEIFNRSVHAAKPETPPEKKKALPDCKYCHTNPLLVTPLDNGDPHTRTLKRCLNCHEQQGVSQAYSHVTHRLRKKTTRPHDEIVQLCADCHADEALLKPFNLTPKSINAVSTYNRSIHGQAIMLGSEKTADCISCHASTALHDIFTKDNPQAMIHPDNLRKTCRQCHQQTNDWFVKVAVHPETGRTENPLIYFLNLLLRLALYGTVGGLMGLLVLETFGRKRGGIRFLLRNGSSWRRRTL